MNGDGKIVFPPFTFDISHESLTRGDEKIPLRPKSMAVLRYFLEHPHRLISKEELVSAVWQKTRVLEAALKVSIGEIRKALGDSATSPKFIQTVGRKGYRFIAPVSLQLRQPVGDSLVPVVGRAEELEQLRGRVELARSGKRQLLFITGEPGIGKTTLIETFTKGLARRAEFVVAKGQCIEQYGAGEAYMPILDAVESICHGPNGEHATKLLRQYAASWLIQIPGLVDADERVRLERESIGISPERRIRGIAAFLESIGEEKTLVLVLEDLHWVDPSTLAVISFLARRREAGHLILLGSYRSGGVETLNSGLKQAKMELELHDYCTELPLKRLSEQNVGEYLAARFETGRVSHKVLTTIYGRSEGNPLFMVNVTDYLLAQDSIVRENGAVDLRLADAEGITPKTIAQLIQQQINDLSDVDRELLDAAAVAGTTFSAASVAAALGKDQEEVEALLNRLVEHQQFLQQRGQNTWPDRTVTSCYSFVHALYHKEIYERLGTAKRARFHHAIAERIQAGYLGVTEEVAAELASHFEQANDYAAALEYLLQAAQSALKQCAYQESINYYTRGSALISSLPKSRQRTELELGLQIIAGVSFSSSKGYATAEAKEAFSKARVLSQTIGDGPLLFQTLAGLWSYYLVRAELRSALHRGKEMLQLASRTRRVGFLVDSHMATGLALYYLGHLTSAYQHLQKSIFRYDLEYQKSHASVYGWDSRVVALCYKADANWLLGYPGRDLRDIEKALTLAAELSIPINVAFAQALAAEHHAYRRELDKVFDLAQATLEISTKHGFDHWLAVAMMLTGWAMCNKGETAEGIDWFEKGITKWQQMGARFALPQFLAFQAEAYGSGGRWAQSLVCIEQGLSISRQTGDRFYNAELHRFKGEILLKKKKKLRSERHEEAEACFMRAIAIARQQKAKSLELRATMSLSGLWQKTGKIKEAKRMLAKVCGWFKEGFDTPDLKAAKKLLSQLS